MPRIEPGPPCVICSKPSVAKNLCATHYKRFSRHGHVDQTRASDWGAREKHPLYGKWTWMRRSKLGCSEEWNDFWLFVAQMGDPPEGRFWLKRRDNSRPFSLENCYWSVPVAPLRKGSTLAEKASRQRAWTAKNKLRVKNTELKRSFGITLADYDRMLDEQNGVCAVCGQQDKHYRLAVDHCHTTNKVRGLLCGPCNLGIGKFKDQPERLEAAAAYLRRSTA